MLSAYALELQEDSPWWAATLYVAGASCAASRVHDQKHWLTDVVFSMGISYASARTVRWWHGQKVSQKPMVIVVPSRDGGAVQSAWTF
jgi:membrane-associated phospholipid phosphatase